MDSRVQKLNPSNAHAKDFANAVQQRLGLSSKNQLQPSTNLCWLNFSVILLFGLGSGDSIGSLRHHGRIPEPAARSSGPRKADRPGGPEILRTLLPKS